MTDKPEGRKSHQAAKYPEQKPAKQKSEGQMLLEAMQARGLLSNDEAADEEEEALEALLPPYGSREEAALFEELASALHQVFQGSGTTIVEEIKAERDE
jgi:hypothetical protein